MTRIFKVIGLVIVILLLCLVFVGCHAGLSVEITWPYDGATVYATPIGVKGAVSDSSAYVTVNNTPVIVAENGYFIGGVDLIEGENTITIVATVGGRKSAIASITVIYAPSG